MKSHLKCVDDKNIARSSVPIAMPMGYFYDKD